MNSFQNKKLTDNAKALRKEMKKEERLKHLISHFVTAFPKSGKPSKSKILILLYYIYRRNFDEIIAKSAQKILYSEKYATNKTENMPQIWYSPAFVEKICGNSKTK